MFDCAVGLIKPGGTIVEGTAGNVRTSPLILMYLAVLRLSLACSACTLRLRPAIVQTGIGLAHICNARGYKCVIYMPNTQSKEKIDLLRVLGAEVRLEMGPFV